MPTVVLPREGQAASSFTLTNSVPGCTIERGRLAQSNTIDSFEGNTCIQMYLPLETLLTMYMYLSKEGYISGEGVTCAEGEQI